MNNNHNSNNLSNEIMSIHKDEKILIKNEAEYPNKISQSIQQKSQPPIQEFQKPEAQEYNHYRTTVQIQDEKRYCL